MKVQIFSVALLGLLVSSAMACPDISGKYSCGVSFDNSVRNIEIQQNGNTFKIKNVTENDSVLEVVADGKPKSASFSEMKTDYLASCDIYSSSMTIDSSIELKKSNTFMLAKFEYVKPSVNNLVLTLSSIFRQNGLDSSSKIVFTCNK